MIIQDIDKVPAPVSRITKAGKEHASQVALRLALRFPGGPVSALNFEGPYECVCAIALSAQTTDENVNKVTPTLFERYPNASALSKASQEDVEEIVHSLGFYRNKARNLINMAKMVVKDFDGEIPSNITDLIKLPGVARKTANLVLTESFGITSGIAIDTHVYRVSHRLNLSRAKTPEKTEGDLCALFDVEDWHLVNYWMISLGRTECDARNPQCESCVLNDICPKKMKF